MKTEKIVWKLATWYTKQPNPPMSVEGLCTIIKALKSAKKEYRMPWSWDITPEVIDSNMGSFLKHLQLTMGEPISGLEWAFYPIVKQECPGCHTVQSFIYKPDHDPDWINCPSNDCEKVVRPKALGLKRIKPEEFPEVFFVHKDSTEG